MSMRPNSFGFRERFLDGIRRSQIDVDDNGLAPRRANLRGDFFQLVQLPRGEDHLRARAASASAHARPIPRLAPVMNAIRLVM